MGDIPICCAIQFKIHFDFDEVFSENYSPA